MVLEDLGVHQSRPTVIHADSQSALKLMENPIVNGRTKHINVTYHYVREQIRNKELKFVFVPTDRMVADIFTKALAKEKVVYFRGQLGVK